MPSYNPADIEPRWQQFWESNKTFRTPDAGAAEVAGKPKYYALDMFPYPSGSGLHVGHPEGYTATDILSRMKRMQGFHVLHPMGWDAFGLPAEQYAVEKNVHPAITTRQNIDTFRRQIKALGFSYDWDREVDTTDPDYVKWTQWIFLVLHDTWFDPATNKGRPISELPIPADITEPAAVRAYQDSFRLAYQSEQPVNWCAALGTVLANEEVIDGKSERGNHPVTRLPLRQWLMRITAYAERLLSDLEPLDWSEAIKQMQRNWIGKSEGAYVTFHYKHLIDTEGRAAREGKLLAGNFDNLSVFTTRPDTLFGATYLVLSPEHRHVMTICTADQRSAVEEYRATVSRKSDFERTELTKTKTGVFTGAYAINPVSGREIPVWIADYVLAGYGTGAIMAVPGHDARDFEFAKQFDLPIIPVVQPSGLPETVAKVWEEHFAKGEYRTLIYVAKDNARLKQAGSIQKIVELYPDHTHLLFGVTTQDGHSLILNKGSEGYCGGHHFRQSGDIVTLTNFTRDLRLDEAFEETGRAINSPILNGLSTDTAKARIIAWLEERNLGDRHTNYKLRDWLFSRQRYWGEPFPILHGPDGEVRRLDVSELPLTLPDLEDFKPTGTPDGPLAKATDWLTVVRDGKTYRRETNTMPQWAGSCWYFLRYIDPHNDTMLADPEKLKYWLPADIYIGGAEHAVLHLLYSRFWHKVLFDRGYVPCVEPFQRLVNQGMILGENNEKMSKARGNVVNPDDIVREYGADSLRLYEMFMGPLEAVKPWKTESIEGVYRFLSRVWRLIVDDAAETLKLSPSVTDAEPSPETLRELHRTIQKVTEDTAGLRFNTSISAMMEFTNHLTKQESRSRKVLEPFVLLLAPYAPHAAEELWAVLGRGPTLAYEPWPAFNPALLKADTIEVPVQVNGKLKAVLTVPAEIDDAALEATALADDKVKDAVAGKAVKKVIVKSKKLVNLVVG